MAPSGDVVEEGKGEEGDEAEPGYRRDVQTEGHFGDREEQNKLKRGSKKREEEKRERERERERGGRGALAAAGRSADRRQS